MAGMDEVCYEKLFKRYPRYFCVLPMPQLMSLTEPEPSLFSRSKTNKTPIHIKTDANGKPDIPLVTPVDAYHTKVVQTMLREYCTTHIREFQGTLHPGYLTI